MFALLLRWRSATLQRRNRILATLVNLRTTELAQANQALQASNLALTERSVTDPLTGLKNRRYLYERIEQDLALARNHNNERRRLHDTDTPCPKLLFLMVDIDHFKQINDQHGHAAGDRVLQQLRDILLAVLRDTDTPLRWGGEEFLVMARFAHDEAGPQLAERLRAAVAAHQFDLGNGHYIHRTCSIGFASFPGFANSPDHLHWEQVINLADECLYAAKHHGRNAWAGLLPMEEPPLGELDDALRDSLDLLPEHGPLEIAASWVHAAAET